MEEDSMDVDGEEEGGAQRGPGQRRAGGKGSGGAVDHHDHLTRQRLEEFRMAKVPRGG